MMFRSAIGLFLLAWTTLGLHAEPLDLMTFHAPPYQFPVDPGMADTTVAGSTVNAIHCATKRSAWEPSIQIAPRRRGVHSLRGHLVDGYFAAAPTPLLADSATLSHPISLEKWYFFSPEPTVPARDSRIGVIAGSNEALWLQRQGYEKLLQVSATDQLLALLKRQRVDGVLMDRNVMTLFWHTLSRQNRDYLNSLSARFVRFTPLHAYFSNAFLQQNPDFLARFNRGLDDCVTTRFELDAAERKQILSIGKRLFKELAETLGLRQTARLGPNQSTLAATLTLDRQWAAARPAALSPLAGQLLSRSDSRALAQWADEQSGLVTEVFVMNEVGAITALNQPTSDYWQGDEDKFKSVVEQPEHHIRIGPLRYDASTERFQLILSHALRQDGDGHMIGAVALGLDIESALRAANNVNPTN